MKRGFASLAAAYGIRAEPLKEVNVPLMCKDPVGIPGLTAKDTNGLFELEGPAVSPPTCDMFIFENT